MQKTKLCPFKTYYICTVKALLKDEHVALSYQNNGNRHESIGSSENIYEHLEQVNLSMGSQLPEKPTKNLTLFDNLSINSVNSSNRKMNNLLKQLEPISRSNIHTYELFFVLKRSQTASI